jgi:peptide chain release factor subunit 1
VVDSLTNALTAARSVKETPQNGLAIYASPSDRWVFEPPFPIMANTYRCGSEFVLEPLEEMLESKQLYGLVVIDRKEASIGLLHGKSIKVLKNLQSMVPQKVNRGGQSQARIQRQADNAVSEWFDKVAEAVSVLTLPRIERIERILVGGPGDTKNAWLAEGKLDYRVRAKVLAQTFDTCYTDEYQGMKELVAKAEQAIEGLEITAEKKLLERFFDGIRTGKSAYGSKEVQEAMQQGRVEMLLLSEVVPPFVNTGSEAMIVSDETELGKQFRKMGGVGAILRF